MRFDHTRYKTYIFATRPTFDRHTDGVSMSVDPVTAPEIEIRPRKVKRRILIVDDDHSQTEVLAHRFTKLGYDTMTAHTGRMGLQRLDRRDSRFAAGADAAPSGWRGDSPGGDLPEPVR